MEIIDEVTGRNIAGYVLDTRRFGVTYIHADLRNAHFGWKGIEVVIDGKTAVIKWSGYGRSLNAGGHKYKAYCNWAEDGRPVPTKRLARWEGGVL